MMLPAMASTQLTHYQATRRYLLQHAVSASTMKRYGKAVDAFLLWVDDEGEDASTAEQLDELLLEYFHLLYEDGRGKSVASATIYGILLRLPQLKWRLHSAHQCLRAWNKLVPDKSYPPLTWELAVVIAVQMTRAGYLRHGIGVLIAFDGLLRVSELCALMTTDIADDGDTRVSTEHKGTLIRIRSSKTGKNQWVKLVEPSVIGLLRWLLEHHRANQPKVITNRSSHTTKGRTKQIHVTMKQQQAAIKDCRLFPFETYQFRRIFKATCANLGISDRYVPHSLRHGGATRYHHVRGWSIEDVLERGRWASVKSARRYIQSGVAMLMSMAAPVHIRNISIGMARDPYRHIITSYLNSA
jgi:integrase